VSGGVLALGALSLVYAGWLRFLGRRAAAGRLGRGAPGIRLPATKVCEHTWAAAQAVAAPRYTMLATWFLGIGAATVLLGALGVTEGVALVVWLVSAVGIQVVTLANTGRDASAAAVAIRCEHQQPPAAARPHRAPVKARPRGGRGKGGKRR
jgi:hypothetical protein